MCGVLIRSEQAAQYRRLYKTARWQGLRLEILANHPLCCMCSTQERVVAATVVDHITPHKGNLDLFWRSDNLQALCKPCHDGRKQRQEAKGYDTAIGIDGLPIDPKHPAYGHAKPFKAMR